MLHLLDPSPWDMSKRPLQKDADWLSSAFAQAVHQNLSTTGEGRIWDDDRSESSEEDNGPQPVMEEGQQQQQQQQEKDLQQTATAPATPAASWTDIVCDLETALEFLDNVIADVQGQYFELEMFERSVSTLHQLLNVSPWII